MDIEVTSHITANEGIFLSYFNLHNPHHIIVGKGHIILVKGLGHTVLPNSSPLSL